MTPRRSTYDVAVVGAGPVGCVAAATWSRSGASVLWLEANPRAAERLAGEWLHPPALRALRALDLSPEDDGIDAMRGEGFVFFPNDGGDPIRLPYVSAEPALAFEHARFVRWLRARVAERPGVDYVPGLRVQSVEGTRVRMAEGEDVEVGFVVGADGRGSAVRRAIGGGATRPATGRMAGLCLEELELPYERHGHVFVGGPGPALLYRIDPRRARLCLDVPESHPSTPQALFESFAPVLPPRVRLAFREALETRSVEWAAVRVSPRSAYGRGEIALVGDAVGSVHPLCAAGMTIGIGDAIALGEERDVERYARRRRSESQVPELLSDALHRVLVRTDPVTLEIRAAMVRNWRASSAERERTMGILAGDVIAGPEFGAAFVRVALDAARSLVSQAKDERALRAGLERLRELATWGRYPFDALVGPAARAVNPRHEGTPAALPSGEPLDAPRPRPRAPSVDAEGMPSGETWDFCVDSLERVSRSFAKPIALLPPRLRVAVTCGYLLCRIADTVEDAPGLEPEERDPHYARLLDVLEHDAPPTRFARASAALPGSADELALAASLDRVLAVLATLPPGLAASVRRWAAEMTRGMQIYSHRARGADGYFAPQATSDLERYCYFVAGTVGQMLTELFVAELGLDARTERALREHAESFGIGLQLVNVLKDVGDDRERKVSFVPRPLVEARGLTLPRLADPGRRADAHAAVAPLFELARLHLDRALEYVIALPSGDARVRLFCLLPLWMAARTLELARGNDATFRANDPVKIDRDEVERLAADCVARAADDARLREGYRALWARGRSRTRGPEPSLEGRTP